MPILFDNCCTCSVSSNAFYSIKYSRCKSTVHRIHTNSSGREHKGHACKTHYLTLNPNFSDEGLGSTLAEWEAQVMSTAFFVYKMKTVSYRKLKPHNYIYSCLVLCSSHFVPVQTLENGASSQVLVITHCIIPPYTT